MNLPQLLSIREASKVLKVHPNTLRNWEKDGLIMSYSINGKRFKRYKYEDIVALLENHAYEKHQVELEYYKAIIDSSEDAIIGKTLDGIITTWNHAAERIYGYPVEEAVGRSATMLFPQERKGEFREIMEKIKIGERVQRHQTKRIRKDKVEINVSVVISPIKNENGKIVGASTIARDITQVKQMQDELRESEKRFRLVVGNSIDLIALLDKEGTYLYVSPSHKRILGYHLSDLLGKKISTIIHPEDLSMLLRDAEKSLQGELIENTEFRLRHKNGNWVIAEGSAQAILDDEGRPSLIVAKARDITERKHAEAERAQLLKQIEEERTLLKTVVDQMPQGVFIAEAPSGKLILSNKASETILGHPVIEMDNYLQYKEYKGFHINGRAYKPGEYPLARAIFKGETVMNEEMYHLRPQGGIGAVNVTAAPIKDNHGNTIAGVVIFSDISERKQEEAANAFLARASQILSSSLDYSQTLKSIAKLAVPLLGEWSSIDILNDNGSLEFVGGWHEDPKKYKLGLEFRRKFPVSASSTVGAGRAFRLGKSIVYSGKFYKELLMKGVKNQEQLGYYLNKLQLKSAMHVPLRIKNKVIGVVSFASSQNGHIFGKKDLRVAEELAKRASLAIENAQLYRKAQEAIALRDDLFSMASHELKTPITTLKIYTDILGQYLQEKDIHAYQQISKIDYQLKQLTKLVTELLDLSRMQTGKLVYHKNFFSIDSLVKEDVDTMQLTTKMHTIIINRHVQCDLYGDRDRIGQVLTNLISNAVKYSPQKTKIIVTEKLDGRSVTITVKDFGIGISPEHQKKIFEQFYQVTDSVEKTFPGLGIGLYLSAEIIKNHHGSIWVESEKGKGSAFSFALPVSSQ